ncbi:MAG: endonuclease/exonuclease/phosphatase family protein [Planctomycetota bacterium]|jgi:endonuclease/exonuclease/phosphatase family metal-dependent hydrolase
MTRKLALAICLALAACRTAPLRVMSLNIAHGRGTAAHQSHLQRKTIESNLDAIAWLLRREQPAVVALQEADGPSFWSGNFDHVEQLAERADYPHRFRGRHVDMPRLSYGTALLSRQPLENPVSHRFAPSLPTPIKGFVVATVGDVDVVSVHLDFLRQKARAGQIREMVEALRARGRPLILLGDFNMEWADPLRGLASALNLHAYAPAAGDLATFGNRRLDWILISRELEFVRYAVVPDALSDHRAVVADVRIR